MGATAGQDIWGRRSPLPPSGFEPLIVYRSLVATDYFQLHSIRVLERMRILGPDRTSEKNGDNFMIRNFLICILRRIIRLNNDGWTMTASKTSEENWETMPLGRPTCRWNGNIKMDLGVVGCQTGLNSSCSCYCSVSKRYEPYGYTRGGQLVH